MSKRNPSRRSYGTGRLYQKSGAWYGRWRIDGQRVNRKIGPAREPGGRDGLTKARAEAEMRRQIEAVTAARSHERLSVEEVGERLIERAEVKGRKPSTVEALRSALRVHLVPQFGDRPLDRIDVAAVDRFIAAERRAGAAPKSIRNYLGVLHSVFELAIERGWARENPVKRATKPESTGAAEIRFLTIAEVEALLVAIPGDTLGRGRARALPDRRLDRPPTRRADRPALAGRGLDWRARCECAGPTPEASSGRPSHAAASGPCHSLTGSPASWTRCRGARRSPQPTTSCSRTR